MKIKKEKIIGANRNVTATAHTGHSFPDLSCFGILTIRFEVQYLN